YPGNLNNCRCNSSSTEALVLMAITGHGPTPPEGGTYYQLKEGSQLSIHVPTSRREDPLTYPAASHPRIRGALSWEMLRTRLIIRRLLIRVFVVPSVLGDVTVIRQP
ncbi:hypothetical protein AVEN_254201-1, partial [Araneus ventricosus]